MPGYCPRCGSPFPADSQPCILCGNPQSGTGKHRRTIRIVLAAVFAFLLLLGFDIYWIWRFSRHPAIPAPPVAEGTPRAYQSEPAKTSDLGVEIYPNVLPNQGPTGGDNGSGSLYTAYLTTNDSSQQVVAFYRSRYDGKLSVLDQGTSIVLMLSPRPGDQIMITVTSHSTPEENQTHLFYSRITQHR